MSCTLFGGMGGRVGWLGWVKWIIVSVLLIGFVGGENGMGEKNGAYERERILRVTHPLGG